MNRNIPPHMKDIVLISPLEDFLINPKEFLPLGPLYLASYLKQRGHSVDVIHGNFEDIREGYRYYGISSSTPQYPKAKTILQELKRRDPDSIVVLGGPHTIAPNCAREALKDGFDYVVVGQGERVLKSILEGSQQRGLVVGEPLDQEEYDELMPDREALNMQEYGFPLAGERAATIITARGCPYRCSFCSISCGKVMFKSPKSVLEEVDTLVNRYGFKKILFLDDSLTVNKRRMAEIFDGLKNFNIQYRCYARADNSYDSGLLKAMLNSGCIEMGVGIESGSQKILDLVNKRTTVTDNLRFVKLAQEMGITANIFLMVGLPGESRETVEQTRDFVEKARPAAFGYNIFTPMPDSPIVVNYDQPFKTGPYAGKSFRDFITLYPMAWEDAVTKAKAIKQCFVSTPDLTREEIIGIYHEEFEKLVGITGFDPRRRGDRGKKV